MEDIIHGLFVEEFVAMQSYYGGRTITIFMPDDTYRDEAPYTLIISTGS